MPISITVKSILNKTKQRSPWFLDDYTINPYSGCSFNCLYCYVKGSKYGTHLEEKLAVKTNAVELLDKQLKNRTKKGQYGFIVISSATDPYLHFEKEIELTRKILEAILYYRFPVHIITKSDLVIRDFDLLHKINENAILPLDLASKLAHKVLITFSFSTLDDAVGKIFEPGAPPPSICLQTLKLCKKEGFYTGVSMMPLLPYISDTGANLELMFKTFKDIGIDYLFPSTITLFGDGQSDSKTLVLRAIERYYPHLLGKYTKLFTDNSQLPDYYQVAFHKKMNELFLKYNINNKIIIN